jgi:2,4-dienoyl-CoA reductase-like NADH-dependent reductase (Old Yellow Enzyme family)
MAKIFEPLKIKSITLRNRIGVSPMCQYSSIDGLANDWHLMHLGSKAAGGAGLVMTEATAVSPEGRITLGDAGIWKDEQIESWSRVLQFIKSQGAVAGMQLAHAGRKASAQKPWDGGKSLEPDKAWETLAPSAVAFGRHLTQTPREMSKGDIKKLIHDFGAAAKRARIAGAEWLEIHAGHGYLLHEYLSPLSNFRKDEFGGSFENRIRILIEVVKSVKANWGESFPLAVRLSATDWVENGWTIEDSIALSKILKIEGVDLIDASSAFVAPTDKPYPMAPSWQVPLSHEIKSKTEMLTAAVGMISDPMQAESILSEGKADLILMAKEYLRNPNWVIGAAKALGFDVTHVAAIQFTHWLK